jgi:hypothetical protein
LLFIYKVFYIFADEQKVNYMTKTELQQTPVKLIELAINKGAEVEQLEKLMDLQERWNKQQAEKAFKTAFVDFQAEKPRLVKDREVKFNGKLQYAFIPLQSIQEKIDPVLSRHGLSYRWEQKEDDGNISITCIVQHVDGHEERTTIKAPKDGSGSKNTVQSIGSTVSYLKRYTLEAAFGLSADVDTDASQPKLKEDLSSKHPKWPGAVEAIKLGTTTVDAIKKAYNLTEANEKKLIKEANA